MAKTDMDDYIKYAAMAAVAYVGYRYAVGQGWIDDILELGPLGTPTQPDTGSGTGPDTGNIYQFDPTQVDPSQGVQLFPNGTAPPVYTPPVQEQPPVQPPTPPRMPPLPGPPLVDPGQGASIRERTLFAAQGELASRGGMMNVWQYNWFLPQGVTRPDWWYSDAAAWSGTQLGRKPANADEAAAALLTFDQYWAIMAPQLEGGGVSGLRGRGRRGVGRVNHWGQPNAAAFGGGRVH